MSSTAPLNIAIVLPPREGFGARRARGTGLTARHHARASGVNRATVLGSRQFGPVFPDVPFTGVHSLAFIPGPIQMRHMLGLTVALRRQRPDLIEVHAAPMIAMWLQRLFPFIPVTLFMHDDPLSQGLTRTPSLRFEVLTRTARVLTPSAWSRGRFLDGVETPPFPPIVIPPCVDFAALPAFGTDLDAAHVPLARRRTRLVLFAGRLAPEKGPDRFIAACTAALPRMPGWRAEVIGAHLHAVKSPETEYTRLLRAAAAPAGIGMMGYRDHPDLMAAMARAAIVVIPGQEPEAGGRAALEAMANGAAVICPRTGAFPEIAGEAAYYVDPSDATGLAAAIRILGSDPRRLAALAEAGRRRAAMFDLPRIGEQLDAARERIVADGPPSGSRVLPGRSDAGQ